MYFVLYTDRLDFFAGAGKPSSGAVPEGRLLVDDVEAVDVLGSGFLILGPSQRLDVQAADKPTFNAWMHAFDQVFGDGEFSLPPPATPPVPPLSISGNTYSGYLAAPDAP